MNNNKYSIIALFLILLSVFFGSYGPSTKGYTHTASISAQKPLELPAVESQCRTKVAARLQNKFKIPKPSFNDPHDHFSALLSQEQALFLCLKLNTYHEQVASIHISFELLYDALSRAPPISLT